jgi:hypothetical protein
MLLINYQNSAFVGLLYICIRFSINGYINSKSDVMCKRYTKPATAAFCSSFQICVTGLTSWPVRASHAHNRETNRAGKKEEIGMVGGKSDDSRRSA